MLQLLVMDRRREKFKVNFLMCTFILFRVQLWSGDFILVFFVRKSSSSGLFHILSYLMRMIESMKARTLIKSMIAIVIKWQGMSGDEN